MTLDEAIKNEEEIAIQQIEKANALDNIPLFGMSEDDIEEIKECYKCSKEHEQLAEWLKELKQLREQMKWIPVSERLPEEGKEVLVWYRYCRYDKILYSNNIHHTYGIGYRCLDLWVVIDGGTETEVYGWMPLPKPYEPQERSDKA